VRRVMMDTKSTNELVNYSGKIVEINTRKRKMIPMQRLESYLGIVADTHYEGGSLKAVNLSTVGPVPTRLGSQRILPPYINAVEFSYDCIIDSFSEFRQSADPISIDELMGLPLGSKVLVQYPENKATFEKYLGYFAGEARLLGGIKLASTNVLGKQKLKDKVRLALKEEVKFYALVEQSSECT